MGIVLMIIMICLVFGGLPQLSGHSYGYGPSGIGAVLLIILVICLLTGRL